MASSSSSSNSPCAACKFLRRKCMPGCIFAPYFPPEEPQKFANVHKIFGASNVTKILNELLPHQREDAVNSLAYEAEARMKDPVYGCVGAISVLQSQVQRLQKELDSANADLLRYACGEIPAGMPVPPVLQHSPMGRIEAAARRVHPRYQQQEGMKGMLPADKGQGPSASKVLAVATLLPVGGTLLGLSGVTLAGTVLGLAVATPLFLLFSPVLVPAIITIGLAVLGFLASGAFGLTALSALSWILNYIRSARVPEHMEHAKRRMGEAAGQVGQKARDAGHAVQSKTQQEGGRREG
ncbi:hypothetical protein J5N97_027653 [Dioscorea zingiberensis]|uniref:Oleosin n=1 Tax=Dioscorea zingiberensis TaxID=325984 RepID=A0A9D5BXS1_9LILI|nr:hypothetical protein J5N97_027653 [Dioscorea zingiberensis]